MYNDRSTNKRSVKVLINRWKTLRSEFGILKELANRSAMWALSMMGERTYLAALRQEALSHDEEALPKEVPQVLREFEDVMPPELRKKLTPRREVTIH